MPNGFQLAKSLLRAPRQAAARVADGRAALAPAAQIYAVYLLTAVLFYSWKPAGFPPPPGGPGGEVLSGGVGFWLQVFAWNPLFLLIGAVFVGAYAAGLKSGKLALRLPAALLATALPAVWLSAYRALPLPLWTAAWFALLLGAGAYAWRLGQEACLGLLAWLMAVNAVAVAFLPLFVVAVFSGSAPFYLGLEILMVLWTLALASFGIARLIDMRVARAFTALLLSTIVQIVFIFALRLAGLIPAEALKALMTA